LVARVREGDAHPATPTLSVRQRQKLVAAPFAPRDHRSIIPLDLDGSRPAIAGVAVAVAYAHAALLVTAGVWIADPDADARCADLNAHLRGRRSSEGKSGHAESAHRHGGHEITHIVSFEGP
jgi:hypothetical protein